MKGLIFSNYCDEAFPFEEAKGFLIENGVESPSDEEVWEEVRNQTEIYWEDAKEELKKFFDDGSVFVLVGHAGLWDGRRAGGKLIRNFADLEKAWEKSIEAVRMSESENGRFSLDCLHHDGTNHWEIKKLTPKGEGFLEGWLEAGGDDDRELHGTLFDDSSLSEELNYAEKVWGKIR